VFSIMAGSLEGAAGGLAGSGEELGSEWEVKSCGGSSVHSQVRKVDMQLLHDYYFPCNQSII
jgi:hypothetical protein